MAETLEIKGLRETQRALYAYSRQLGDKVVLGALRRGANLVLKQAKANAPVRTGRLKKSLRVKNSRRYKGRGTGIIGVRLSYRAGKSRNDPKGAYYAIIVEDRKHFVKRAYESQQQAAARLITQSAIAGAEVVARRTRLK